MYGSDSGGAGSWVLALLELVVIVPVVVVVTVLVMAGRSVLWLARSGQQLIQRPPIERELQRIARERNDAITDILRARNQGERELRAIGERRLIPGSAEEWSQRDAQPMGSPVRRPLTAADVMTAAEVSALLRVPRSTVEDWARRGIVPSKKVGRRRLYVRSRIEALLLDEDPQIGM
jgi:excisionase family DNA binding protein